MRSAELTQVPPNFCTLHWLPRGQPSPSVMGSACTMMGGAAPPEAAALVEAAAGGHCVALLPTWLSPLLRNVAAGLHERSFCAKCR